MSDYGDDYSDYGDDWMYLEDEYMAADDLAEHAIASPPPTAYGDDDMVADWDRFDYFNDLEYASDGFDDARFQTHDVKDAKLGQKRKRAVTSSRGRKKRRKMGDALGPVDSEVAPHSPVIWRSQKDRGQEERLLEPKVSYALLSDWRDKLADTPRWAQGSPPPKSQSARLGKSAAVTSNLLDEAGWEDDEETEEDAEAEGEGDERLNISQDALMAALQGQLAAAGGPLSGMDPQQLLQFAMRMATNKDAGDDIAGEMAEAMLGGEEEEGDEGTEEDLLSWVAKQRNANKNPSASEPKSPEAARDAKEPPTPPSSEPNRSVKAARDNTAKSKTWTAKETRPVATSLKRKAGEDKEVESSTKTTKKKRATRSFDAPTAASQARTSTTKTRITRSKR